MDLNDKFCGDYQKPTIKPSLHELITDSIVSKRLAQKKRTNESNSHSIPFRVILNESIPQLSQSTHSSESNESRQSVNNDYIRRVWSPSVDSGLQLSSDSCLQNVAFNLMDKNDFSFGDNRYNRPTFGSLRDISSIDINSLESRNLDVLSSSRIPLDQNKGQNNRLYNSCPSSPVIKRLAQNSQSLGFMDRNRSYSRIKFHEICGSDVTLSEDKFRVSRHENSFASNCYAFVSRQLSPEIGITIQLIGLQESNFRQSFIFGITNVNPSHMSASDLPNDPQLLVKRRDQMWTLVDNFCDKCKVNDRLTFNVDSKGFVSFSINSYSRSVLFPIQTPNQELWPFFDLIGRIKEIQLIPYSENICPPKPLVNSNIFDANSRNHLYKCLNCLSKYANTAFYKCGHKYYCYICAKLCFDSINKCPLCSQHILDLVVVFP